MSLLTGALDPNALLGIVEDYSSLWIPLVAASIIFFKIVRPHRMRIKAHEAMLQRVQRGDTIITSGGIIAKVKRQLNDGDEVEIEIADGVEIRILRATIAKVHSRNTNLQG